LERSIPEKSYSPAFQGVLKLEDFIAVRIQCKVSLHKLLYLAGCLENPEAFWERSVCHKFLLCPWQQAPIAQVTGQNEVTLEYWEPWKTYTCFLVCVGTCVLFLQKQKVYGKPQKRRRGYLLG